MMKILTIPFEEHFYIQMGAEQIKLVTFATTEPGNIKFGIEASREVKVHREEVYQVIQKQLRNLD